MNTQIDPAAIQTAIDDTLAVLLALPENVGAPVRERLADVVDDLRAALPPAPLTERELAHAADLITRAAANGQLAVGEGDVESDWVSVTTPPGTVALTGDPCAAQLEIVTPSKP